MHKEAHSSAYRLNPLDSVEDLLIANDWIYKRLTNEELILSITGKTCDYALCFTWSETANILRLTCEIDEEIPEGKMGEAILVANELSQNMALGFFVLDHHSRKLVHHYSLVAGDEHEAIDRSYLATVVENMLRDCEENFTLIKYFLNKEVCADRKAISLLVMPSEGRA